jgi:hypothetical protein
MCNMGPPDLLPFQRKLCYRFLLPLKFYLLNPQTVCPIASTLPLDNRVGLASYVQESIAVSVVQSQTPKVRLSANNTCFCVGAPGSK